jgi:hypothetical protein
MEFRSLRDILLEEAREFSNKLETSDSLFGRLTELNEKLEFASNKPPKPLDSEERSRFDRRRRVKNLPDKLGKAKPVVPSGPKPTAYARELIRKKEEAKALEIAKTTGRKKRRPQKVSPLFGKKKGDLEAKAKATSIKRKIASKKLEKTGTTKSTIQVEADKKPSQAKKINPRHPRVTGKKSGMERKGAIRGRTQPSEKVNIPELDTGKKVSTLPESARNELARKLRNKMSNQGVNRGLGRTKKIIDGMRIGTLLKTLGMEGAKIARFIKK